MSAVLDLLFNEWSVGFGVPILLGTGFTLLADEFKEFKAARICFFAAALWAYGKAIMWGFTTSESFKMRALVVGIVGAAVTIGLVEVLRLTSRRETAIPLEPPPSAALKSDNSASKPKVQTHPAHVLRGLTYAPPAGEIRLEFKASPFFNHRTKRRIARDITRFRDYLTKLGIPVPIEVPPISIAPGENTQGSQTPPGLPTYRGSIQIGKKQIKIPSQATSAYCQYTLERILFDTDSPFQPWFGDMPQPHVETIMQLGLIGHGLTDYFNLSFWNLQELAPAEVPTWPWTYRLWMIRRKFGREFTDRLAAYALKSMIDNPDEGKDGDLDVYFARKLKISDSVVDASNKWPQILELLKEQKVPADKI